MSPDELASLLAQIDAGLSPEAQARLVEQEERETAAKAARAQSGRTAHLRPPDALSKLKEAHRALVRAAEALRLVWRGTRLIGRCGALAEEVGEWVEARKGKAGRRNPPRPVARRRKKVAAGPLLPWPEEG